MFGIKKLKREMKALKELYLNERKPDKEIIHLKQQVAHLNKKVAKLESKNELSLGMRH